MKFSVVVPDKAVTIDGIAVADIPMESLDPTIHAVHWNGVSGEVERRDATTGMMLSNTVLADVSAFITVIALTQAKIAAPVNTPAPPLQTVSKFQAKVALLSAGLLDTVETYMAAASTPRITKLAWAEAQEFKRGSPTVLAMAALLGLSSAQIDQLFVDASRTSA